MDKTHKSKISDLFYCHVVESLTCETCSECKFSFSYFKVLPLELLNIEKLPDKTIDTLVKKYFEPEVISGFKCPFCKQISDVRKHHKIYKPPRILLLFFKRFSLFSDSGQQKINDELDLSPNLTLNRVMHPKRDLKFQLLGFVNHYGTLDSGHYTATCKVKNNWVGFSDHYVASEDSGDSFKPTCKKSIFLATYLNLGDDKPVTTTPQEPSSQKPHYPQPQAQPQQPQYQPQYQPQPQGQGYPPSNQPNYNPNNYNPNNNHQNPPSSRRPQGNPSNPSNQPNPSNPSNLTNYPAQPSYPQPGPPLRGPPPARQYQYPGR